jgi:hypothetical protein
MPREGEQPSSLKARGALSRYGRVPGFPGPLTQPQTGHPDLARRTFMLPEVSWRAPLGMPTR